jgi:hypothetical protein
LPVYPQGTEETETGGNVIRGVLLGLAKRASRDSRAPFTASPRLF